MNILSRKKRVLFNVVDTAFYLGFERSRNAEYRTHDGRNCFGSISDFLVRRGIVILKGTYDLFSLTFEYHKMFAQLFDLALLVGDNFSLFRLKICQKFNRHAGRFRHFFYCSKNEPNSIFVYITPDASDHVKYAKGFNVFLAVIFPNINPNEQFLQSCVFFLQELLCSYSFSGACGGGSSPIGEETASERHHSSDHGANQCRPSRFIPTAWVCTGNHIAARNDKQCQGVQGGDDDVPHTLHAACGTAFRQAPMVAA